MTEKGSNNPNERIREHTELEDVTAFAEFFLLDPMSDQVRKITGLTSEELMNVLNGETQVSRRRFHSAVLGRFARDAKQLLESFTGESTPADPNVFRSWLERGRVITSQGPQTPIDAFSDTKTALEASLQISETLNF